MRDLQTMKSDRFKLCNHEYWGRYRTQELMKLKMDNLKGYLKQTPTWRLIKQHKLYKAIADRMGWEMAYWDKMIKENKCLQEE